MEFEKAKGNKYKISDIKQTEEGFEFRGTADDNGIEESLLIKLSDGYSFIYRPFICLETSFNKIHNYSMIYQKGWRLGKNRNPERRLFQDRTYKYVDTFDRTEYYPYDGNNVFELRVSENGIISKNSNEWQGFSEDDGIRNIKITYK